MFFYMNFFFQPQVDEGLKGAAELIASLFDGFSIEKRESSNYIEGEYYRGQFNHWVLTVAYSDGDDSELYRYWLSIESRSSKSEAEFQASIKTEIHSRLLHPEVKAARVVNFGKKLSQKIIPIG